MRSPQRKPQLHTNGVPVSLHVTVPSTGGSMIHTPLVADPEADRAEEAAAHAEREAQEEVQGMPRFHTSTPDSQGVSEDDDEEFHVAAPISPRTKPKLTSSPVQASAAAAPSTLAQAAPTPAPAAAPAPTPIAAVAAPQQPPPVARMSLASALRLLADGARFLRYTGDENSFEAAPIQLFLAPLLSFSSSSSSSTPIASSAPVADASEDATRQPLGLYYCGAFDPSRPRLQSQCMALASIQDICRGSTDGPLRAAIAAQGQAQRGPAARPVRDSECFVLQSRQQTLSLQAESNAVRNDWVEAICTVLEAALHKQRVVATTALVDTPHSHSSAPQQPAAQTSSSSSAATSAAATAAAAAAHHNVEAIATEKAQLIHSIQLTLIEMVRSASELLRTDFSVAGGSGGSGGGGPTPKPSNKEFDVVLKRDSSKFSHITSPSSVARNEAFEAKSYAPTIFARMRALYGLQDEPFLQSVAHPTKGYNDLIVNSKSGSFFFYTHDNQFLLKSCSVAENKLLCNNMLPSYYAHHVANPDTLLSQILGTFRLVVRAPFPQTVHFLIMRNVFASGPATPIHVRFDLKGSTFGRAAKASELAQLVPVLKDKDFFEGVTFPDGRVLPPTFLHLGRKKHLLLKQLRADAEYLRSIGIMDYSLLVGIHFKKNQQRHHEAMAEQQRQQKILDKLDDKNANGGRSPISGRDSSPSPSSAVNGGLGGKGLFELTITDGSAAQPNAANAAAPTSSSSAPAPAVAAGASSSSSSSSSSSAAPAGLGVPLARASSTGAVLPVNGGVHSGGSGATSQTNYGTKPQKELLIPRGLLRKATLVLLGEEQRQAIKHAAAAQPTPAPTTVVAAPRAIVAFSALSTSSSSSSSLAVPASSADVRPASPRHTGALALAALAAHDSLFEPDGTLLSQFEDGSEDGSEVYYLVSPHT